MEILIFFIIVVFFWQELNRLCDQALEPIEIPAEKPDSPYRWWGEEG